MDLKSIRLAKGLSVPQLVELSGVPRRTIQEIESGRDARLSNVIKLAAGLGVSLDELCGVPYQSVPPVVPPVEPTSIEIAQVAAQPRSYPRMLLMAVVIVLCFLFVIHLNLIAKAQ